MAHHHLTKYEFIVVALGMVLIAALIGIALWRGIDGTVLTSGMALIGGAIGYAVGASRKTNDKTQ
jgi:1,4-dihydroxy-2-naphthoate octaprenyltransferase